MRRISTRAMVLITALLGFWPLAERAIAPSSAEAQHGVDTRQRLRLAARERAAVLAEMRQMLGSVSGILHGVVADDRAAIEKAARASGLAMAADPQLERKLPRQFLAMGTGIHTSFDQLAEAAKAGAPRDELLKSLADLSSTCIACHAIYRF